jgi:glutamine cyclotransferase
MRRLCLIIITLLGLTVMASAQDLPARIGPSEQTPQSGYKVVHVFPHDKDAFTQGLLFHEGVFYEGTGQYSQSEIRRVDIKTGRVLQNWALPDQLFGEGITLFKDYLFGLSWRSGVGFILARESFKPIGYFQYDGQGWGLTDDEKFIYMSNGSDQILVRDPSNFNIIRKINVNDQGRPVIKLNELEWINGEIWANIWQDNRIARINPETGAVISWLDLTELVRRTENSDNTDNVLNGIGYDPKTKHVFVTGKYWPKLYALEIDGL